jgi:hypothetical protein
MRFVFLPNAFSYFANASPWDRCAKFNKKLLFPPKNWSEKTPQTKIKSSKLVSGKRNPVSSPMVVHMLPLCPLAIFGFWAPIRVHSLGLWECNPHLCQYIEHKGCWGGRS